MRYLCAAHAALSGIGKKNTPFIVIVVIIIIPYVFVPSTLKCTANIWQNLVLLRFAFILNGYSTNDSNLSSSDISNEQTYSHDLWHDTQVYYAHRNR